MLKLVNMEQLLCKPECFIIILQIINMEDNKQLAQLTPDLQLPPLPNTVNVIINVVYEGQSFAISINQAMTVRQLKENIRVCTTIQEDKQVILFADQFLDDTKPLAHYGVQEGDNMAMGRINHCEAQLKNNEESANTVKFNGRIRRASQGQDIAVGSSSLNNIEVCQLGRCPALLPSKSADAQSEPNVGAKQEKNLKSFRLTESLIVDSEPDEKKGDKPQVVEELGTNFQHLNPAQFQFENHSFEAAFGNLNIFSHSHHSGEIKKLEFGSRADDDDFKLDKFEETIKEVLGKKEIVFCESAYENQPQDQPSVPTGIPKSEEKTTANPQMNFPEN